MRIAKVHHKVKASYSPAPCRGLTLVEVIASMSVAALALGGITSALVIASRATDSNTGPSAQTTDARIVTDRITADLNHTLSFSEQTTRAVTFNVPDRNGDGTNETIRYAWSGTPGDPLTQINSTGDEIVVAENVDDFQLSYLTRPPFVTLPAETTATTLLSHYDPSYGTSKNYSVDQSHWCAQYFKPNMPKNAVSWNVNYIYLALKQDNFGRIMKFEIQTANARQTPTGQVMETVSVYSNNIPLSYTWSSVSFSGQAGLDPQTGACVVIRQVSGSTGVRILYIENGSPMPRNSHWTTTGDTGVSWSTPVNNKDMLFYVYGTITTEGPAEW